MQTHRDVSANQAPKSAEVLAAYNDLRAGFLRGLYGDLFEPIETPSFRPQAMPTWQVVEELIGAQSNGQLVIEMLRVLIRASEGQDPVLCSMASGLIARMAREHATYHQDDKAEGVL